MESGPQTAYNRDITPGLAKQSPAGFVHTAILDRELNIRAHNRHLNDRHQRGTTGTALAGVLVLAAALAAGCQPTPTADEIIATHAATINRYCIDCHSSAERAGDLTLERIDLANAATNAATLENAIRKLRAGMMPPADQPRPEPQAIASLVSFLETELDAAWMAYAPPPGMHRLNRAEYRNAIRDLLALEVDTTVLFPADDVSRGFDNQAGTLGLSPALLEAYLTVAGRLSRLAIGSELNPTQVVYRVPEDQSQHDHIPGLPFGTRGGTLIRHTFPADGEYQLRIFPIPLGNMGASRPFGDVRGEQLVVFVDNEPVAQLDWDQEFGTGFGGSNFVPRVDVAISVTAGVREIGVTFLANTFAPGLDLNHMFERTTIETGGLPGFTFYPHIGNVRIDGPFDARRPADSPSRAAIFRCRPASSADEPACARDIIATLARRAYRGHQTDADIDLLMTFYDLGRADGEFESGIEMALQRMLVDPKFLYRIETPPEHLAEGEIYRLGDLELASRLSFFLWSSLPDDELLTLAEQGRLGSPDVLRQQVMRMLEDERSFAFTENFAGQWLALRDLDGHVPTPQSFPDFDHTLRVAFQRETALLFDSLVREDRSIVDLLTADYTFLNERLARHYGIPGIRGSEFRRVELGDAWPERHGLLGKGSLLTVTSQPGRTSPVMRGDWVLANVIGVPAPPPPPDVPEIEASSEGATAHTLTIRQQYERHRNDPACMGCHVLMDPIGFALEAYDGIGRFRTVDLTGNPIDTADVMYDGTPIDGASDLLAFFLRYETQYVTTFVEKLLTYALGRGVEYVDMPVVRAIVREGARDNYNVNSLVAATVASDLFQMNTKVSDDETIVARRQ
jgi:hypothetical protein